MATRASTKSSSRARDPIVGRPARIVALERQLGSRILVLDGAMGTMIQDHGLAEEDYRGSRFAEHPCPQKGNNDLLSLTQPDLIRGIHAAFLSAGADILETNTFNSTAVAMADYMMEDAVYDLNRAGATLAREAAEAESKRTPEKPRFVAGAIGPTPKTLSLSPDVNDPAMRTVTFAELHDAYAEQTHGLIEGGVDLLLVEKHF